MFRNAVYLATAVFPISHAIDVSLLGRLAFRHPLININLAVFLACNVLLVLIVHFPCRPKADLQAFGYSNTGCNTEPLHTMCAEILFIVPVAGTALNGIMTLKKCLDARAAKSSFGRYLEEKQSIRPSVEALRRDQSIHGFTTAALLVFQDAALVGMWFFCTFNTVALETQNSEQQEQAALLSMRGILADPAPHWWLLYPFARRSELQHVAFRSRKK